jgi:predicted membrane channel-forming protein YqfA (hemolysin III family)
MSFSKNVGIFFIVIGTLTIFNAIIMGKKTSLKKNNMIIGVILFIIGVIFYSIEGKNRDKIKLNFG